MTHLMLQNIETTIKSIWTRSTVNIQWNTIKPYKQFFVHNTHTKQAIHRDRTKKEKKKQSQHNKSCFIFVCRFCSIPYCEQSHTNNRADAFFVDCCSIYTFGWWWFRFAVCVSFYTLAAVNKGALWVLADWNFVSVQIYAKWKEVTAHIHTPYRTVAYGGGEKRAARWRWSCWQYSDTMAKIAVLYA